MLCVLAPEVLYEILGLCVVYVCNLAELCINYCCKCATAAAVPRSRAELLKHMQIIAIIIMITVISI